jgi:AraC-like DNA-binding protein
MIRFGAMSITLLVGAMYGTLFAAMLWWNVRNRLANRLLALLLIVITLRLLPYIIGYAGYYDAYPWLSFLPYNLSLAIGPLLYLYVMSLFSGSATLPKSWVWHLLPVALQLAYYSAIFPQPLAFKNDWNATIHVPFTLPVEQLATFVSIGCYWARSYLHYRQYQHWLADNVSDREEHHVVWVRNFLIALALTLIVWMGFVGFDRLVAKLDYFQQFPLYVWLAVLGYYLGTEGYRHANHRYPAWSNRSAAAVAALERDEQIPPEASPVAPTGSTIDWAARGQAVRQQLTKHEWWRDPSLTLADLARKLGTNTSDLSRAINDGLDMNFNELINRLRVAAVQAKLAEPAGDANILDLALSAGFSSKASFNRSFKLYTGETPTHFRARQAAANDVSSLKS